MQFEIEDDDDIEDLERVRRMEAVINSIRNDPSSRHLDLSMFHIPDPADPPPPKKKREEEPFDVRMHRRAPRLVSSLTRRYTLYPTHYYHDEQDDVWGRPIEEID